MPRITDLTNRKLDIIRSSDFVVPTPSDVYILDLSTVRLVPHSSGYIERLWEPQSIVISSAEAHKLLEYLKDTLQETA